MLLQAGAGAFVGTYWWNFRLRAAEYSTDCSALAADLQAGRYPPRVPCQQWRAATMPGTAAATEPDLCEKIKGPNVVLRVWTLSL